MKNRTKKLVLFDIDGTLIQASQYSVDQWKIRVVEVFRKIYGKHLSVDFDIAQVNGKVERRYFREIAQMLGVSKNEFEKNFPYAAAYFHTLLKHHIQKKDITFTRVKEAYELVSILSATEHIRMGLVTGNIEKNAWLKLASADFDTPFRVGGFGDVIEDRGDLVLEAVKNSSIHYNETYDKTDIIVVGDTVHDIASAKKAGVVAVGVATGITETYEALVKAGGDVVVRTLMDRPMLALLDLE